MFGFSSGCLNFRGFSFAELCVFSGFSNLAVSSADGEVASVEEELTEACASELEVCGFFCKRKKCIFFLMSKKTCL